MVLIVKIKVFTIRIAFAKHINIGGKIVYNFVDMAIYNAYFLYKLNNQRPMSRHAFLNSIIINLTEPQKPMAPVVPVHDLGLHLTISALPGKNLRICKLCQSKGLVKKKNFWCPECNMVYTSTVLRP